jgi:hypothetical protein
MQTRLRPFQQGFELYKKGVCNGHPIELHRPERQEGVSEIFYIYQVDHPIHSTEPGLNYTHNDLTRLEQFFKLQFESIEWE